MSHSAHVKIHSVFNNRFVVVVCSSSRCRRFSYLQRVLGTDCQDLVLEVAELTAPGASLTDPADKAGLMGATHRAITATGAQ